MATLVLTAVGTAIGGPLGGAVGSLIGQAADRAIIGGGSRRGPRLKELGVQSSTYGSAIARVYGRMRVAGSVIWSTDLVEHSDRQGGGKGRPSTTTYSYSASFAVALASRPIKGVGRIWADGTLIRGAAGDSKTGSPIRVYPGTVDQQPDPLIAQAEGDEAPAYRGIAYVLFEDLPLADFGNRIPGLTFEILADGEGTDLVAIVSDLVPEAEVFGETLSMGGYAAESGRLGDELETLGALSSLGCVTGGGGLSLRIGDMSGGALVNPLPPTVPGRGDEGVGPGGTLRTRTRAPASHATAIRYYEIERDYQPGLQRARGRAGEGPADLFDLPAALSAGQARAMADRLGIARRKSLDRLQCRIGQLGTDWQADALVSAAGSTEAWRVGGWEWHGGGIDLELERTASTVGSTNPLTDPGRALTAPDLTLSATVLHAVELPWDGVSAQPRRFAAASAKAPGWRGAALYWVNSTGELEPTGSTGRTRAVIGTLIESAAVASPLYYHPDASLTLSLVSDDLSLASTTLEGLARGDNLAMLGEEVLQFVRAQRIGAATWRVSGLLRGRAGTEHRVADHEAGTLFTLLDDRLIQLPAGETAEATVLAAIGPGDDVPALAPLAGLGSTRRPLSPVHPTMALSSEGLTLTWLRRARGAWPWSDGIDVPVNEQQELWRVAFADEGQPIQAQWEVQEQRLEIPAAVAESLERTQQTAFLIRQVGEADVSPPLRVPFTV